MWNILRIIIDSPSCILWLCVFSLSYPACNALSTFCRLWPAPLCNIFLHYLINGTIFENKNSYWTQNLCFDSSTNLSKTFLIPRKNERDVIKKVYRSALKYPLFLSDFNENWIFSTFLRKILKYQISLKHVQWEPSTTQTDGRTDMTFFNILLTVHPIISLFTNLMYKLFVF